MGQTDTSPFSRAWKEAQAKGPAVFVKEGDVALTQIWQVSRSLASSERGHLSLKSQISHGFLLSSLIPALTLSSLS